MIHLEVMKGVRPVQHRPIEIEAEDAQALSAVDHALVGQQRAIPQEAGAAMEERGVELGEAPEQGTVRGEQVQRGNMVEAAAHEQAVVPEREAQAHIAEAALITAVVVAHGPELWLGMRVVR